MDGSYTGAQYSGRKPGFPAFIDRNTNIKQNKSLHASNDELAHFQVAVLADFMIYHYSELFVLCMCVFAYLYIAGGL